MKLSKKHWLYICIFVVIVFNIKNKLTALNPSSLWLDDVWVATLVKNATISEVMNLSPGVPIGFITIQKLFYNLIPDPELSQQLFPFICSLLFIPIITLAIFKLIDDLPISFLVAFISGVSPFLNDLGVRNKPYASDCLIGLILLILFYRCLICQTFKSYLLLAVTAIFCIVISYVSIFWSFILVNILSINILINQLKSGIQSRLIIVATVVFNISLFIVYLVFLKSDANQALYDYWQGNYLPISDVGRFISFCRWNVRNFFAGPFQLEFWWMFVFIIPGLVWAFLRDKILGLTAIAFYFAVFAASALQKFPLGTGRTDTFSYSLTLLLSIFGVFAITEITKYGIQTRWVIIFVFLVCFSDHLIAKQIGYPCNRNFEYIDLVNKNANDEDAIIIYPHANFAMGYYGKWTVGIVPVSYYGAGYQVNLKRKHSLTLPGKLGNEEYRSNPQILTPVINEFLKEKFQRVIYISGHANKHASSHIQGVINNNGFRVSILKEDSGNQFVIFDKVKENRQSKL